MQLAYRLKTMVGKAKGVRKYTVAPLPGNIAEVLGSYQVSLHDAQSAAGEWYLVCLAFNLKRFHTLSQA